MEQQWFEYKEWDQADTLIINLYDCTLKVDLGPFPKGSTFSVVCINYEDGIIEFFKDEQLVAAHHITLSFGDSL